MQVAWTKEQQQVIDARKQNILVSAAAGSGKTAVLVERIRTMITDTKAPVDIDRLLIVTFTNAAAAEMRERIGAAIEKALEEHPANEHLQRQLTLIHNAQITTIDSFCLYVVRNHFHEIDLEPNFRIGDEGELKLLKEDVLKKVLLQQYEERNPAFTAFANGYSSARSDAPLGEMILKLYEFSRSYPWPKEWLDTCVNGYHPADTDELNRACWMLPLTENIRSVAEGMAGLLEEALALTQDADGPDMYEKAVKSDLDSYRAIASLSTFTELYEAFGSIRYQRLASSRGYTGDAAKQERVKELREQAKDAVKKINRQYFFSPPEVMVEQLHKTEPMAKELVRLTGLFADRFAEEKRRKNLVDFHDLEHFALRILVDEETKQARKAAEEFRDTFEEIMIDEYQDSNHVQEAILRAVSKEERGENNIFMVGDVKQSIYRFRLARPELFMEKYDTYPTGDCAEDAQVRRIDLHKNFRSRDEVLSCTNDVFYRIMRRDLGNVEYNSEAALYPGAVYPAPEEKEMFAPEILIADSSDELYSEEGYQDKKILEAVMTAAKIKKLMKEVQVTDKTTGELRKMRYSDIVILLRSLNGWADSYASVLNDAGIPAHTLSATGYFSAVEVQTVLSMLRILDNPRQDIPLTAVLRSPIVGLSDEELALIRLKNREESFHACVLETCEALEKTDVTQPFEKKLKKFYTMYQKLRSLVPDTPIHELIEILLKETGYGDYAAAMPAGSRRHANLLMLVEKAIAYENTSYKGLFHFVRYIDELQKYNVDFGEADMVGENEDVVRIMSIHKSKGLEFPVVFVAGLGKNFNRQDVRSHLVLHPELGLGLDCMDGERRIKSPTIAKKAIAKQIDLENLGEELRVLYVALTRAKEKLILTGTQKEAAEALEQMRYSAKEYTVLPYMQREGAGDYLEWVLPALLSCGERYPVEILGAAELVTEEISARLEDTDRQESRFAQIAGAEEELVEELDRRFSFVYPNASDIRRKNKYSVSELKHRAMREHLEREEEELTAAFLKEEIVPYIPPFVQEQENREAEINRGALRGTAVHRVMECFDFTGESSVKEQIAAMRDAEKITEAMQELVKVPLIEAFVRSQTGLRMKAAEQAKMLYREKPFVMGFTEAELTEFGFGTMQDEVLEPDEAQSGREADLTLIQGIIDVFWKEEDGIVLLDYKTDRVDTAQELVNRYQAQLKLYAEALERVYNSGEERVVRVKEKLLYSFCLGKIIPV